MTPEELHAAEDRLEQYLVLILRIYDRITSDPESYAQFRLLTGKTGAVSSPAPGTHPVSHSLY